MDFTEEFKRQFRRIKHKRGFVVIRMGNHVMRADSYRIIHDYGGRTYIPWAKLFFEKSSVGFTNLSGPVHLSYPSSSSSRRASIPLKRNTYEAVNALKQETHADNFDKAITKLLEDADDLYFKNNIVKTLQRSLIHFANAAGWKIMEAIQVKQEWWAFGIFDFRLDFSTDTFYWKFEDRVLSRQGIDKAVNFLTESGLVDAEEFDALEDYIKDQKDGS